MIRKLTVAVLVLSLVMGIAASAALAQDYRISVVLKALNSDYWKTVEAGATQRLLSTV